MKNITAAKLLWAVLLVLATSQLSAEPLPPTQWHCINTAHFDIIFKGRMGREAQRMANTLEYLYGPVGNSLGASPGKIPIVLNNQLTRVNGFWSLCPETINFYTFPSQDYNFVGSNDWLNVLAVHEFRHAVQHAKLKQNFNWLASYLSGDLFVGSVTNFNVPKWFFEGDAVGTETALTQSGRGRLPNFLLLHKVNLLEHGGFSYQKQICGSLKDKVTDAYKIGYHLTTYIRRQYGAAALAEIWERTTFPRYFYTTIKRVTGRSFPELYADANQALKTLWEKQLKGLKITPAQKINPGKETDYTDYAYPHADKAGNIIALKSGMGTATQFVLLSPEGDEKKLCIPGPINEEVGFSAAKDQIVWVENVPYMWKDRLPSTKWSDRSYSVIMRYDKRTKRTKQLTYKSRYGSAALSPDATKIVAYACDEGYNHSLVILDAEDGRVLQRLPNPDNHFYITPGWAEDGKKIIVVKNVQNKVTIALIDVATGEDEALLPYSTAHIGCPVMLRGYVFYNSAYSGIDNIYAVDLVTRQRYQVTSRKYGAYNPSISTDGRSLIFNDFTRDGMDVVKMPFVPEQWTPLEEVEDRSVRYYEPLVAQEDNGNLLGNVPEHKYAIKRYHPWKNAFKVHSWLMFEEVAFNTTPESSSFLHPQTFNLALLKSRDVLDTTELGLNYKHDFNTKSGGPVATVTYKGFYPIISAEGGCRAHYHNEMSYTGIAGVRQAFPLTFVQGEHWHRLVATSTTGVADNARYTWYTQTYKGYFSRYASHATEKDIKNPWLQELTVRLKHTPYGGDLQFLKVKIQLNFHFPGFYKHHLIYLSPGYEYTHQEATRATTINGLKGKEASTYAVSRNKYIQVPNMSAYYNFPICYPDWGLGYLVYIKRIRANVCYVLGGITKTEDFDHVRYSPTSNGELYYDKKGIETRKSPIIYEHQIGIALLADIHLLLTETPLTVGGRYLYSLTHQTDRWMFVLGMKVQI